MSKRKKRVKRKAGIPVSSVMAGKHTRTGAVGGGGAASGGGVLLPYSAMEITIGGVKYEGIADLHMRETERKRLAETPLIGEPGRSFNIEMEMYAPRGFEWLPPEDWKNQDPPGYHSRRDWRSNMHTYRVKRGILDRLLYRPWANALEDDAIVMIVTDFIRENEPPAEVVALASHVSISEANVVADWLEEAGIPLTASLIRDPRYGSRARLIACITIFAFMKPEECDCTFARIAPPWLAQYRPPQPGWSRDLDLNATLVPAEATTAGLHNDQVDALALATLSQWSPEFKK